MVPKAVAMFDSGVSDFSVQLPRKTSNTVDARTRSIWQRPGGFMSGVGRSPRDTYCGQSIIEEASKNLRAVRVLELAQRLRLDLADALARHGELLADL